MNTSHKQILREHYGRLARRAAVWAGAIALVVAMVPVPGAQAAQITSRSVTLGSSAHSVSTTYGFSMVLPTTGTNIQSFGAQACTTALGSCTTPTGWNSGTPTISVAAANFGASGVFVVNTATAGELRMTTNGGTATTGGPSGTSTVTFGSVTNPTTDPEITFYLRITTYSNNNWTGAIDTGTVAVSTANQMTVNADVSEYLSFCVGATVGANCSSIGAASISLAPNPLTSGAVSYNTAQMGAATNAVGGYTITYYANNMTSGGNVIDKADDGGEVSTTGQEQFGFTLRNQTSGNLNTNGTDPSGGTGITVDSNYNSQNSTIAYDITGPTNLATASGPTAQTTFTMLYAANVAATTEPGSYSTTQTFICTGTF